MAGTDNEAEGSGTERDEGMMRFLTRMGWALAAVCVPIAALADVALAPIMSDWNRERHHVQAMLNGDRPYDPAAIETAIRLYVSKADMIADRLPGQGPAARAFAERFRQFARDAEAAGAARATAAEFRPRFRHLVSDCNACHAAFR